MFERMLPPDRRLEAIDPSTLNLSALRRHRNKVTDTLRRGVPDARRPGLEAYLRSVRAELDLRRPRAPAEASIEECDFATLLSRYRSEHRRLAWAEPSADRRLLRTLEATLGATPSEWAWLRRCAARARDLALDLDAQDLSDVERRKSELGLLRAVRAGWTRVGQIMVRTQHPAVREAALVQYRILSQVADRAVVLAVREWQARWIDLFREFGRDLPEALCGLSGAKNTSAPWLRGGAPVAADLDAYCAGVVHEV